VALGQTLDQWLTVSERSERAFSLKRRDFLMKLPESLGVL
jgi:hypothetical protein